MTLSGFTVKSTVQKKKCTKVEKDEGAEVGCFENFKLKCSKQQIGTSNFLFRKLKNSNKSSQTGGLK